MVDEIIQLIRTVWYAIATFVLSKIICIPFIRRPLQKLDRPDYYEMRNAINLKIPINPIADLGTWYIRACDKRMTSSERWKLIESSKEINQCKQISKHLESDNDCYKKTRNSSYQTSHSNTFLTEPDETVILYLHGNSETRSQRHRRELYKKFQALGLVVMAPDYRGYADSYGGFTFQTSESTLCEDAIKTYYFLKQYIHPSNKVIIWGHSLGTGVTTRLAYELRESLDRPDGYVLEAPFNTMKDEVATFWIAKAFKLLLDVDKLIEKADLKFNSEHFLQKAQDPFFVLHAEDDKVIPYQLGRRLYEVLAKQNTRAKFYSFQKNLHLGHNDIYKANSFDDMVKEIVLHIKKFKS